MFDSLVRKKHQTVLSAIEYRCRYNRFAFPSQAQLIIDWTINILKKTSVKRPVFHNHTGGLFTETDCDTVDMYNKITQIRLVNTLLLLWRLKVDWEEIDFHQLPVESVLELSSISLCTIKQCHSACCTHQAISYWSLVNQSLENLSSSWVVFNSRWQGEKWLYWR